MKAIKIDKKNWAAGLEKLEGAYHLFGPVKNKEFYEFKALEAGKQPDLSGFKNTAWPG